MSDILRDIRDLEERRRVAMLAGDVTVLGEMFAEQMAYTHSNAEVDNRAEYLEKLGNGHFNYHDLSFLDQDIRIAGDTVLITGRMIGAVTIGGALRKLNGQTTVVWVRQEGRWQLLAFQSTAFPAV